jgi:hypothetical protein
MAVIEFRSLVNPDHIFMIFPSDLHPDNRWGYTNKAVNPQVAFADCMGDYPTKHTPPGLLISERLEEFLHALARHMRANGCNPVISQMWPKEPKADTIQRFHKLKYSDKKPTYYNHHGETSVALSAKHDTRWTPVPEWAHGANTPAQIYGLYTHGWHNSLYALIFLKACAEAIKGTWTFPPQFVPAGITVNRLEWLLACVGDQVNAYKMNERAASELDTYEGMKEYDDKKVTIQANG